MTFTSDSEQAQIDSAAVAPKVEKKTTARDIETLLSGFEPSKPPVPTAAEKERARRATRVEVLANDAAGTLRLLGLSDAKDLGKAEAAVKALAAFVKNAKAAIESIPDAKLVDVEAKPTVARKPRQSVTRTLTETDAQAAVEREIPAAEPDEIPAEIANPESPDEDVPGRNVEPEPTAPVDEEPEQPAAPRRSGPGSQSSAPRGDTDPNLGDGF